VYILINKFQDYINNRRRNICDNNNLELKSFVSELKYIDGATSENELFIFGAKFGDGSENDHFQLGKFKISNYIY
jgi:hypothetical protein